MHSEIVLFLVIILAILYDFTNGWNDAANAIATVVSTRVLTPIAAVIFAGLLNMAGAFYNTEVAKTIGKGIADPRYLTQLHIAGALLGAVVWNVFLTINGMPISITHSLVSAIAGAGVSAGGFKILNFSVLKKIGLALIISPILGFFAGMFFMWLLLLAFRNASPSRVNRWFGFLQLFSSGFMSFSHGANDAQNAMGIITAALLAGGFISEFEVPRWVILLCGTVIAVGTFFGGWRVVRTLGQRIYSLKTIHGFTAETTAALVMIGATRLGIPISTTHVITSTIVGVGSSKRLSAVRWGVAFNIVFAWVATIPACAILGYLFATIFKSLF